jgi:RNA-splicing ligase RtcB
LLRSGLSRTDVLPRIKDIVTEMWRVPTGVGSSRRDLRVTGKDMRAVLEDGAQ